MRNMAKAHANRHADALVVIVHHPAVTPHLDPMSGAEQAQLMGGGPLRNARKSREISDAPFR